MFVEYYTQGMEASKSVFTTRLVLKSLDALSVKKEENKDQASRPISIGPLN